MAGIRLIAMVFVSDSITNATSSLVEYSYLVKRFCLILIYCQLQELYLCFCTIIFNWFYSDIIYRIWTDAKCVLVTVSLLYCLHASCMHWNIVFHCITFCFFRDVVQIVSIVLQIVFWITPIVWQMSIFDEKVQWALNFNPLFYPVRGYRDALMSGKCFWEYGFGWNLYYWLIALAFV